DDAASYCRRWLRLAREADDVSQEAAGLRTRGRVADEHGDLEAMGRSADGLVDLIDRLPTDEERAQAMATIAQSYMLRDQVEASCEWADKARELAQAHGLTRARLGASVGEGCA